MCHVSIPFFFSSRRRHTSSLRDWSSDVCSSDLDTLEVLTASQAGEDIVQEDLGLSLLERLNRGSGRCAGSCFHAGVPLILCSEKATMWLCPDQLAHRSAVGLAERRASGIGGWPPKSSLIVVLPAWSLSKTIRPEPFRSPLLIRKALDSYGTRLA